MSSNSSINASIEERLTVVEAAVRELQKKTTSPNNWLEQITGSFQDKPAFDEVLSLGRAIRQCSDSEISPLHLQIYNIQVKFINSVMKLRSIVKIFILRKK